MTVRGGGGSTSALAAYAASVSERSWRASGGMLAMKAEISRSSGVEPTPAPGAGAAVRMPDASGFCGVRRPGT